MPSALPPLVTVGGPQHQPGLNVDGNGRPSIRSQDHSTNDTTSHARGNRAAGLRVNCNRCHEPNSGGGCENGQLFVHCWPQFFAGPGCIVRRRFGAVYAIPLRTVISAGAAMRRAAMQWEGAAHAAIWRRHVHAARLTSSAPRCCIASSQSCGGTVPKSHYFNGEAPPYLPGGGHLCRDGVGGVATR
jgi:hypothetical protein